MPKVCSVILLLPLKSQEGTVCKERSWWAIPALRSCHLPGGLQTDTPAVRPLPSPSRYLFAFCLSCGTWEVFSSHKNTSKDFPGSPVVEAML